MIDGRHLTEEERQGAADGTLDAERRLAAERHIAACAECARDVASLRALLDSVPAPAASSDFDDLWPSIRSRIEASKVVPLEAQLRSRISERDFEW